MFLYTLTRSDIEILSRKSCDASSYYAGAVVLASNEEEAKTIHPDKCSRWIDGKWQPQGQVHDLEKFINHEYDDLKDHDLLTEGPGEGYAYINEDYDYARFNPNHNWVKSLDKIKVSLIGTATPDLGNNPCVVFTRAHFSS